MIVLLSACLFVAVSALPPGARVDDGNRYYLYGKDEGLTFNQRKIHRWEAMEQCENRYMTLSDCSKSDIDGVTQAHPDWVDTWHTVWCSPMRMYNNETGQDVFNSEEGYQVALDDDVWAGQGHGFAGTWKTALPEPDGTGDCSAYRLSEGGEGMIDVRCEEARRQVLCVNKPEVYFSRDKVSNAEALGACDELTAASPDGKKWYVPLCDEAELKLMMKVNPVWMSKWTVIWCQYVKQGDQWISPGGLVYDQSTWARETNYDGKYRDDTPEPDGSGDCTGFRTYAAYSEVVGTPEQEYEYMRGMIDLGCDSNNQETKQKQVKRWAVCFHETIFKEIHPELTEEELG